ncbi:MAG: S8 family serine peptidase, partial [Nitrospiraceae bacterium]|nr:S8 family serine peptidase [Nitrospiraceae bacterium]
MRTGYEIILVCLVSSALLLMTGCGEDPSSATPVVTKASPPTIPPGYSSKSIHVKFQEGTNVERPLEGLPPGLRDVVVSHTKLFSLPEQKLNELRARGRSRVGTPLPDLSLWVELTLRSGTDAAAFLAEMKRMPNIEIATSAPLPQPPPWIPPDFTRKQGYLDPAPGGIEARFSWTIPGGNGSGVTIYDIEYNWLQTHDDLSRAGAFILLLDPGDSNSPPGFDKCPAPCDGINREHGTATLGVMIADYDTRGVTGISWGAKIGLAPANTLNLGYNPANAIILAVANGSAGDVILLEQQFPVCGLSDSFGPIEVLSSVFDAIQTAVAQGFVVIEAAGNGGVNLDQAACSDVFDRTLQDSGAIIVGAGQPPSGGVDRQRERFSSFGSRIDLQGWGSGVVTTGYGDLYTASDRPADPDFWYAGGFSGTSSAAAIVAGAVANLQGIALAQSGVPLPPLQIRTLLVQTGSPQLGNTA